MATSKKDKAVPEKLTPENVGVKKVSAKSVKANKEEVSAKFTCEVCGGEFKSKPGLMSHTRSAHPEQTGEVKDKAVEVEAVEDDPGKFEVRISSLDEVIKNRKENMVSVLEAQPKVMFMIPIMPGEKPGSTVEVCINGLVMVYPKGEYFEAPMSVVELLREYERVKATSGAEYRVDRDEKTQSALS